MKNIIPLSFLLLLSPFVFAQNIDDQQSKIQFQVSNMGVRTVEGTIKGMKGTVHLDRNDLKNVQFNVSFDVATIDTDNKARDKHLRKPDFFEVDTYPTIQFQSTSVVQDGKGYKVKGILTIKDVSKEIEMPFTVDENNGTTILTGNLTIDRKTYHVGMDTGKFMVGYAIETTVICVLN